MGSANSNAEALERRRVEREMRLGLYAGSTAGLDPIHMGMTPVNPYQHLGWPAQTWLAQHASSPDGMVNYAQPSGSPTSMPSSSLTPSPAPAETIERPPPAKVKKVTQRAPVEVRSPSPTRLRWVGTSPKKKSPPSLELLGPAREELRFFLSQARTEEGFRTSPRKSLSRSGLKQDKYGKQKYTDTSVALKPFLKQALYLLATEEIEGRASVLNEEVDAFDVILATFSYVVELEHVRIAAFELFKLEKISRKTTAAQERRERRILEYWMGEDYEDAALESRIRSIKTTTSPSQTPSVSPWRFRLGSLESAVPSPLHTRTMEKSSFLSNSNASPSPVPPERSPLRRRQVLDATTTPATGTGQHEQQIRILATRTGMRNDEIAAHNKQVRDHGSSRKCFSTTPTVHVPSTRDSPQTTMRGHGNYPTAQPLRQTPAVPPCTAAATEGVSSQGRPARVSTAHASSFRSVSASDMNRERSKTLAVSSRSSSSASESGTSSTVNLTSVEAKPPQLRNSLDITQSTTTREISPILQHRAADEPASENSVYLETLPSLQHYTPYPNTKWRTQLEETHDELDKKILRQRAVMSSRPAGLEASSMAADAHSAGGRALSPVPKRRAPQPATSPRHTETYVDLNDFRVSRTESAAAVRDRFAALLNASV